MSRVNRLKLRAMLLKWQRTKDISLAHDICTYLSSTVAKPIPVTYIPTKCTIEVKHGRN